METRLKRWFGMVLAVGCLLGGSFGFAEETDNTLTQDELAIALVQKLFPSADGVHPSSSASCMAYLLEQGISPFGGWTLGAVVTRGDLARILVQASGLEEQIPAEDRDNPNSPAFQDLLVERFGIDLSNLEGALQAVISTKPDTGTGVLRGLNSSDPLQSRLVLGAPQESTGGVPLFGTVGSSEPILAVIIGSSVAQAVEPPRRATTPNTPPPATK